MLDENDSLTAAVEKRAMMTSAPVGPLICKLAVPTVTIMLVSGLYNMADTYFVSSLGTSATAGVGVVFSFMAIIQAVGFFFGHGSGNFISRSLGAQKIDAAQKMAATGFFSAFGAGVIIAVLGTIFMRPFARLLGSTDTILPYALEYLRYILLGAPFMVSSLMLNNILRYQGSAVFGMIGMTSGAVINIALDPLFIFVFDMGVRGASLATMISQCISFSLLLLVSCRGKGNLKISFKNFSPKAAHYREIIRGGTPSLLRQGMSSVATLFLNHAAGAYGDAVIAAISIVNRVTIMINSTTIGLGQSFQPVCGFNFGAKEFDRVKKAFFFCLRITTAGLVVLSALCFIFAPAIIAQFRGDDEAVIRIGVFMLRANCLALPFSAWTFLVGVTTQTIGKALPASLIAFSRQGLFLIPQLFFVVPVLGVLGIQISAPIAEICSFILALGIGIRTLRRDLV